MKPKPKKMEPAGSLALTSGSAVSILRGSPQEIECDLSAIDARIADLRMQCDCFQKSFEYEVKSNIRLEVEIKRLRDGIIECLMTNRHLADGDDCTLIGLKRLLWPNKADSTTRIP